jgi:phage terminase large subunit-like protein
VYAVAEAFGYQLMAWQRMVLEVACEVDEKGRFVYREVIITVPRQSGKTTLILCKCTHRCLAWQRQVVTYAAQTRNDSRKKWEDDYLEQLLHSPFANRFRPRKTNGNEAIIWHNTRSRFGISSTTEKAGHGSTLDEAYIDEAFAQQDARLEQAFKPAMITRRNAQMWVVSTAGTPKSLYLADKVARGRAAVESGITHGICYFEWSADEEETDYGNPDVWRACMPALHWPDCDEDTCTHHTVTVDAVAADYLSMPLNEFRRAYLNQWCEEEEHIPIVDPDVWDGLKQAKAKWTSATAFGIAVNPERTMASIGASGERRDGRFVVEVIENQPGTAWVVARCKELQEKHETYGFWIDKRSGAGSLVNALIEAGIKVEEISTTEFAQACGQWYDDATQDKMRHRGDPRLTGAMLNATKREVGDAWAFERRGTSSDITPLDACTLARYGAALHRADLAPVSNVW